MNRIKNTMAILVVSGDHEVVADVERALDAAGIANPVLTVDGGRDALEYLTASGRFLGQPTARVGLVLVEAQLRDMHASMLLEQLKRLPGTAELPALVINDPVRTAGARDETWRRRSLTRPVDAEDILHALLEDRSLWVEIDVLPGRRTQDDITCPGSLRSH